MTRQLLSRPSGFTLIEVILVVVIIGVLVTVALRTGGDLFDTAKIEQTRQELDALAFAIAGNPEQENNGVRSDFGYVGDVGSMPPNLDALYANPGGYATWNGPYISNRFTQVVDDYKKDAFGTDYFYGGGATITSIGSGSNIVRRVAPSSDDLLYNSFSGNVLDRDGSPPGSFYKDSLTVRLTYPSGSGGMVIRSTPADPGGYFAFDSIPIGNHGLEIVHQPTNDTVQRLVSVAPNSSMHSEYRLPANVWYAVTGSGGALTKVTGSDSLMADCHGFYFRISNTSGAPVAINSITVSYSLTGYYRYVRWNGSTVVNQNNPSLGSGDLANFTSPQTIADGTSLRIEIDTFRSNPVGGPSVDVDNTTFTVAFSDGSSFDVTTGVCP